MRAALLRSFAHIRPLALLTQLPHQALPPPRARAHTQTPWPAPTQAPPHDQDVRVALKVGPAPSGPAPSYNTVLGVCDSDHKPVYCELEVSLPAYVQAQKQRASLAVGGHSWGGAAARSGRSPLTPTHPCFKWW